MNWDRVEGNWKEINKVHQQWGKLTNDDLAIERLDFALFVDAQDQRLVGGLR
jgi:hypothetical protein